MRVTIETTPANALDPKQTPMAEIGTHSYKHICTEQEHAEYIHVRPSSGPGYFLSLKSPIPLAPSDELTVDLETGFVTLELGTVRYDWVAKNQRC